LGAGLATYMQYTIMWGKCWLGYAHVSGIKKNKDNRVER